MKSKPNLNHMLTPSEAAVIIGCSVQQVRTLCRTGKLPHHKEPSRHNQHGYNYFLTHKVVLDYKNTPQPGGFPRGVPRKSSKTGKPIKNPVAVHRKKHTKKKKTA